MLTVHPQVIIQSHWQRLKVTSAYIDGCRSQKSESNNCFLKKAQIGYFSHNSWEGDEGGRPLARWSAAARLFASSPSIHSSLLQNSVFFDPKAFSGLNHKGVGAAYFLEWEEVEVGEVVAREVEMVSNPSVPVHNVHFGYYDGPVVKSWNPKIHFLMGKQYFWGHFSYVVLGRKL